MEVVDSKEGLVSLGANTNDAEVRSPANEPAIAGPADGPSHPQLKKMDLESTKTSQPTSEVISDLATSAASLSLSTSETQSIPSPSSSPSPPPSHRSSSSTAGFPRSDYVPPLPGTGMDATNVFIKYLPTDMTNTGLFTLFSQFGEITSCKVMIDPITGYSLGYGFVRFSSAEEATKAIDAMYGTTIGNKTLLCKLSHGIPQNNATPSDNLYIKPLLDTTTEEDLMSMFSPHGTVLECKVMLDKNTGQSRQIGFVRFATIDEATKALAANNGRYLTDEAPPMVVKYAESRVQKIQRRAKLLANQAAAENRRNNQIRTRQAHEMMVAEAARAGDAAMAHEVTSVVGLNAAGYGNSEALDGTTLDSGVNGAANEAQTSRPYIMKDEYGNVTFGADTDAVETSQSMGGVSSSNVDSNSGSNGTPYWSQPNYPSTPYSHHHQNPHGEPMSGGSRGGRRGANGVHGGRQGRNASNRVYYQPYHHQDGQVDSLGENEGPNDVSSHGMHHNAPAGHNGLIYRKKGSATYVPRGASNGVVANGQPGAAALPTFRDSPTPRVQLAGKVEVIDGQFVAPEWADDPTRLFISHLPSDYDAEALRKLFEVHGPVANAKISQDKRSARLKTYGFVQFVSAADAAVAVKELHGIFVDGRTINVAFEATQSVAKHKHEMQQYYYMQQAASLPTDAFYPGNHTYIPRPPHNANHPHHHSRNARGRARGPRVAHLPPAAPGFVPPYYPPAPYEMGPDAAPYMYMVDPNSGVTFPVPVYFPGMPLSYAPAEAMAPEYQPSNVVQNTKSKNEASSDSLPAAAPATAAQASS